MNTIFFKNPVFKKNGLNLTVRKGLKWSLCLLSGEKIMLNETGSELCICSAKILNVKAMSFHDLKDSDLIYEHDPKCRSVKGLTKVMKDVYNNFDERELITLVYFEVI